MIDPAPPAAVAAQPDEPRHEVTFDTIRTDISLCLQMVAGKAVREAASREAFSVVAGAIVAALKARGYQITAPPPAKPYGWPPPSVYLKE